MDGLCSHKNLKFDSSWGKIRKYGSSGLVFPLGIGCYKNRVFPLGKANNLQFCLWLTFSIYDTSLAFEFATSGSPSPRFSDSFVE
jgi:hypothetical protein